MRPCQELFLGEGAEKDRCQVAREEEMGSEEDGRAEEGDRKCGMPRGRGRGRGAVWPHVLGQH